MSIFNKVTKTFQWGGKTVVLETGEIARQSGGAVVVSIKKTPSSLPRSSPRRTPSPARTSSR